MNNSVRSQRATTPENQLPQERGVTGIKGGEPFVVRDKMRGVCVGVQCGWEA